MSQGNIEIRTHKAPEAVGPYSQAVRSGDLVFLSGQIPLNPENGEIEGKDIKSQTVRVFENLKAVLEAAETDLDHVVRADVFLSHMDDFQSMNEVYARYFTSSPLPARQTVEVSRLPKDVLVEISCIAVRG